MSLLIYALILFNVVSAVPGYSVESSAGCSLCHINPSGGGLRSDYGTTIFAADELPMKKMMQFIIPTWDGAAASGLRIGGDFRFQLMMYSDENDDLKMPLFPMQADVYAQYGINPHLNLVYRQALNNAAGNEYWMLVFFDSEDHFLKIGKSLPDYGLKLDDHSAFIRGGNIRLTHGLEKEGLFFGPYPYQSAPAMVEYGRKLTKGVRITASISNAFAQGSDSEYGFDQALEDKAFTARLSLNSGINQESGILLSIQGFKENDLTAMGINGGFSYRRHTLLFEADWLRDWTGPDTETFVNFIEWKTRIRQGIHFSGRYEFFDPDLDWADGAISRYSVGFELFPLNVLGVKFMGRISDLDLKDANQPSPEWIIQLHTFL